MKRVFLHGGLGKRFGKKWNLAVNSPQEAISALFANNPDIEKYLNQKQKENIHYGIKNGKKGDFIKNEELSISTKKDLHLFPLPQGSSFAVSLAFTAVATAASMYVARKISETMQRDDSTVASQTKSFVFDGQENRYQQGASVPVGYGRMKVGSNVVSSCNVNYDYNSDKGSIFNFTSGLYSLIPKYSKYYNDKLGPLGSSFHVNQFDGSSDFKAADPAFLYLKNSPSLNVFGANDGSYGQYEDASSQQDRYVTQDSSQGNAIGGYMYYSYNYFKGLNKAMLGNAQENGNWFPDPNILDNTLAVPANNASTSSLVCLQSVPTLGSEGKVFYPICFADNEITAAKNPIAENEHGFAPVQVGERWKDGDKNNGVGWFKLESASVYKSIDLVCEGPIDGFANTNGETLTFSKEYSTNDDPSKSRNAEDDYLQGIYLDDYQAKEVNPSTQKDSYNINEFDIDIGMSKDGVIGANDQTLLEPQYLFTANTKEVNGELFGPRAIGEVPTSPSQGEIIEFQQNKIYKQGEIVSYENGGKSYNYSIDNSLSNKFSEKEDYSYSSNYTKIVYRENGNLINFYAATPAINEFAQFDGRYVDRGSNKFYQEGDKVKSASYNGGVNYYEMGRDADHFIGVFDSSEQYIGQEGKVVMLSQGGNAYSSPIYKITGSYQPGEDKFFDFTTPLTYSYTEEAQQKMVVNDPLYILMNTDDQDIKAKQVVKEVSDIKPETSNLWQSISISGPGQKVKNGPIGPGTEGQDYNGELSIFKFSSSNSSEQSSANPEEEYYIAHNVINPLVEELYVTLQIDELAYVYQGDELEVEYSPGALMGALFGFLIAFEATAAVAEEAETAAGTSAAVVEKASETAQGAAREGKISARIVKIAAATALGALLGALTKFKIGTKVENSGEVWPNRAKFRIKYGNEGEPQYSTDIYIYGVASSTYRKDIKIYLPPNPSNKDRKVKIFKLNRERNPVKEGEQAARYKERFSLAGITEITPVQLNYANSVVIGTRVNAKDVPSIPKRNYHLKLKKVAIPSNYNPETRVYSGNWNGMFKGQQSELDHVPDLAKEWTDNPAWCLYDLISDKRYGVGKFGIKPENIDRWTLYKIAKYCDEFTPTGYSSKYPNRKFELYGDKKIRIDSSENLDAADFDKEFNHINKRLAIYYDNGKCESIKIIGALNGELTLEINPAKNSGACAVEIDYPLVEPRYTLNAFLMDSQNAFNLINEFAAVFRTFVYWSGGAVNFFQDEKKDPVMLFANNNVSEEGFSYAGTPKTSRSNSCKIKYVDRFNQFRPRIEYSEDRASIQKNNIIEKTIDGFGITSQGQAKRAADFIVKTANMETEIVSFRTSSAGSYLRPGDIIDVLDNKRTIGRFAGKVIDIEIAGDARSAEISIDYPINSIIEKDDAETWKNITLYSISGNETIESLDSMVMPTDKQIENMRAAQVKNFIAADLYEDNKKITIVNNPYRFISGDYSWKEAADDAKERGGSLASINNEADQILIQSIIDEDQLGWIGGYYLEMPQPSKFVWDSPQDCGSSEISFYSWAEGFPKIGDKLETNLSEKLLVTDCEELIINTDPPPGFGDFIAVSGSADKLVNGDWVTLNKQQKIGYILELEADESFFNLKDIEGTTFAIEDSVNLAKPKPYKVLNITESSNGIFEIQALQYSEEKFDNIEKNISIKEPESPVIFTTSEVEAPSQISLEILEENFSAKIPYGLKVSWNTVSAAASYKIQFFEGNILLSTFEVPNDKEEEVNSFSFRSESIKEDGNYYARVYSIAT